MTSPGIAITNALYLQLSLSIAYNPASPAYVPNDDYAPAHQFNQPPARYSPIAQDEDHTQKQEHK